MYELKDKDFYSQSGEGFYLEYIFHHIGTKWREFADIGGGDGFYLSNTRHLQNLGWEGIVLDLENGIRVDADNVNEWLPGKYDLISIDVDGNDYWILEAILKRQKPSVIIAEFNPAFTDSRAIKYNPDHDWGGTDYYGFSFNAGEKLAAKHGYKIVFNVANMNLIMVREDHIDVEVLEVTFTQNKFFKESNRPDWVMI